MSEMNVKKDYEEKKALQLGLYCFPIQNQIYECH